LLLVIKLRRALKLFSIIYLAVELVINRAIIFSIYIPIRIEADTGKAVLIKKLIS